MLCTRSSRIRSVLALLGLALVTTWIPSAAGEEFADPLDLLGIGSFECQCSQSRESGSGGWLWLFQSEPRVVAVDPEGPSDGRLQPGDVLVAVDGRLITTRAGGRRFSTLEPGETVELTVRRDGFEHRERIELREPTVASVLGDIDLDLESLTVDLAELSESLVELARLSPDLEHLPELSDLAELEELVDLAELEDLSELAELGELAQLSELAELSQLAELGALAELSELTGLAELGALSELSELSRLSELEGLEELDGLVVLDELSESLKELAVLGELDLDLRPLGWFGMGLSFSGSMVQRQGEDTPPLWIFEEAPQVRTIDEDGPAARAGLENGDRLTHIDGIPMESADGGRRFSEVRPGETVEWTVRRGGKRLTVPVTAEERPE